VVVLVILGAAVIDAGSDLIWRAHDPRPQDVQEIARHATPLNLDTPYAPADYAFLAHAIGSASIVQLGESLHITQEFPRIRLRLIEYLHEQLGFDTLALEGSLTQSWLAQESLYRSQDRPSIKVARAQEMAWFRLWRTQPMRELMAYVFETQSTSTPLYLTSFDIEIGASSAFGNGEDLLATLFAALQAFGPPPDAKRLADWHRSLAPILHCSENFGAAQHEEALATIDALGAWIETIAPRVTAQRPAAHMAALRMIPDNFRDNVALCTRAAASEGAWQATRDELNAKNALMLRDEVSAAHKIILWAHHSHVAYNSTGRNIDSMGEHLHAKIPSELYTIGLFAGGGRVIDGALFGERDLPTTRRFGVERLLQAVHGNAYFVDVKRLPTTDPQAGWLIEDSARHEVIAQRPTVLAKDFDGAVYVAHVHPTEFMDSVAVRWMLRILGFLQTHFIAVGIVLMAAVGWMIWGIASAIGRRVQRWRASS
jgi:erythromycin esterase